MNKDKIYRMIALFVAFLLLIALLTPFAVPVYYGVDSKEALSFVWIWGLCFGQGEFFFLLQPSLFNLTLIVPLIVSIIVILVKAVELNRKKVSFGKFGEHVFICSFLIFPIMVVLSALIEYNFLFFPDIPLVMGKIRADFWFYHNYGFGYFGLYGFSFLSLIISVASMYYERSNFFLFALALLIIFSVYFLGAIGFYFPLPIIISVVLIILLIMYAVKQIFGFQRKNNYFGSFQLKTFLFN